MFRISLSHSAWLKGPDIDSNVVVTNNRRKETRCAWTSECCIVWSPYGFSLRCLCADTEGRSLACIHCTHRVRRADPGLNRTALVRHPSRKLNLLQTRFTLRQLEVTTVDLQLLRPFWLTHAREPAEPLLQGVDADLPGKKNLQYFALWIPVCFLLFFFCPLSPVILSEIWISARHQSFFFNKINLPLH